ncbi:hypothetical protein LUZ60_008959 [Juncus effusus]|nr:hypothetical protein LUZ60_008959 [Juncus effusus]
MSFMSSSMVSFSQVNLTINNKRRLKTKQHCTNYMYSTTISKRKNSRNLIPFAKYNKRNKKENNKPWWQTIFPEDENKDEILDSNSDSESDSESEGEKFESWRRKAEAIIELREAQEDVRNEEERAWEDWVFSEGQNGNFTDWDDGNGEDLGESISDDPREVIREKGIFEAIQATIGENDEDLLFEDRVFKYASLNSAKFIALLILIPSAVGFVVHDYVLMPFLDRYVKKVPLAAELLDVRRSQKLRMVKELKIEKARFTFEVEIGKSPPLSDEEVWWELRHKALEMRDELRLENRNAFANILSDGVNGFVLFLLLYFNESKVALLKFTGYKLLNNISDAGKAFLIICISDIFLGYHSEEGWDAVIEMFLERYGLEVDRDVISIFIFTVPVVVDTFFKFWMFKYLPRLSQNVANIVEVMERH